MKRTTREWVKKAEVDWVIANQCSESAIPLHDGVCFHCQQCAEKYLKGLLHEDARYIPKTHNLADLLDLLSEYPVLISFRRGLILLTRFAVETRYPGESTGRRQAQSALRWAEQVRAACRSLLDADLPRHGRKKSR